jgi:hypothetical protein
VLTGQDPAGNIVEKRWEAWADAEPPVISIVGEPAEVWTKPEGEIRLEVRENLPEGLQVRAVFNGEEVALQSVAPAEGEGTGEGEGHRHAFSLSVGDLAEGAHRLVVEAGDLGGHRSSQEVAFVVDSTDVFGRRAMVEGARGSDARQLNRLLAKKGYLEGDAGEVFDSRTSVALADFKKARGLPGKGVLDKDTIALLVGSIRIDISERRLYHYDEGKLVKTYPVAVGKPQYPTPTGSFRIVNKAKNPTWTPPPSPWAAGLEPVPPGPNNPLGTRWMGISSPSIGIHGTYSSGSIGTAASHGCIRMHIRDVEELFDRVYVGTPVTIVH